MFSLLQGFSRHVSNALRMSTVKAEVPVGSSFLNQNERSYWTLTAPLANSHLLRSQPDDLLPNHDCPDGIPGNWTSSRGMRIKGRVKRRCRNCYLIYIEGILHNLCPVHGRHKQMLRPKRWENTRIITHFTNTPIRPW